MKNTYILTISVLSLIFSSFASGKTLSVTHMGEQEFVLSWSYGSIYKTVNSVHCLPTNGNIHVFLDGKDLGACLDQGANFHSYDVDFTLGTTSAIFTVRNYGANDAEVSLEPRDVGIMYSVKMGDTVTNDVPAASEIQLNVADSIDFGTLKTGETKSRAFLFDGDYSNGKGIVTVIPAIANNQMGEIQDKRNKNSLYYTVNGGTWDDNAGGWVFKDGLQHDLVINPEKLELEPGQYAGTVTVTLASE
ncbi:hypothetical protein ACO03_21270 (plasmid) [Pantoea ananatis]|nr:hypothetical protein ACO03_21270 [Pantoea ananatis]